MRLSYVNYAHGARGPRGPDLMERVPRPLRFPIGGRDYPPPRQGRRAVALEGEPSVRHGPQARQKPAVAPPAAPSEPSKPPRDRAPSASPRPSTPEPGLPRIDAGMMSGILAAWFIALALLVGLALLSAVSDPPRPLSPDELARASLRTPHERATSGQY